MFREPQVFLDQRLFFFVIFNKMFTYNTQQIGKKIMLLGKQIRLERIINRHTQRTIIVPMDHGTTLGPIDGLVDMREAVNDMAEGGADAVLMHKGLIRCSHRKSGKDVGLIIHLSASTSLNPNGNRKAIVTSVEEAVRNGADGVSVHVNLGDPDEASMLRDFGMVAESCNAWGMPLLAMLYARGPHISQGSATKYVAHCARVGVELGADIVKVMYTGSIESFEHVVNGCCVPVVIAGGDKMDSTQDILQMAYEAVQAGAAGLSVGRNVFQHPQRRQLVRALRSIVHDNENVKHALELMQEEGK